MAYYRLAALLPEKLGFALLKNWLIVQFMSSSLAKTKDRARRRWIHAEHHTYFNRFANRDVVVEAFLASISTDVSAFASRITVPTLLVAAELDDITPVAAQHDLQAHVPARPRCGCCPVSDTSSTTRCRADAARADPGLHRVVAAALKILFDCRYTRFDRHDGISRYTTGLVTALARLHPVTMLISDERQLGMLPDLPWILGSGVTSVNEPWIALTVNRVEPGCRVQPDADDGLPRPALPAHPHPARPDLLHPSHPAAGVLLADQAAVARLPPGLLAAADRAGPRRRDRHRLRDGPSADRRTPARPATDHRGAGRRGAADAGAP